MIYFQLKFPTKWKTEEKKPRLLKAVEGNVCMVFMELKTSKMLRHVKMDDGILYINLLFDYTNVHGNSALNVCA